MGFDTACEVLFQAPVLGKRKALQWRGRGLGLSLAGGGGFLYGTGSMFARWPRPLFYIVIVLVLAADQASKAWVRATLPLHDAMAVIPGFFDLTFTHNTGVAFGMFQGEGLVVALLVVALAAGAFAFTRGVNWAPVEPNLVGGAICGGALGNLLDRGRLGYVVDFLDFHLGLHHWYIFNVADSCICVAVTWLVVGQLRSTKVEGRR